MDGKINYLQGTEERKTLDQAENRDKLKLFFSDDNSKYFHSIQDMEIVGEGFLRIDLEDRKVLVNLDNINFLENETSIRIQRDEGLQWR